MVAKILFALLLVVVLVYIFGPLASKQRRQSARREEERERLEREKGTVLALIRDLEFDFRTGKMLEADYQSSRADAETRAMAVLRRLDELSGRRALTDPELEEEIARVRGRLKEEAVQIGS